MSKAGDVKSPSNLIFFASSRGGDVKDNGAFFNYGEAAPNAGTIRPGYWLVEPPTTHPYRRGGLAAAFTLSGGWNAGNKFNPAAVPSTWGNMDMRYDGKAVIVRFDGSVVMQGLEQLRDMTKWSNVADRPDWTFPTNIAQINW